MSLYTSERCQHCLQVFTENDDIVVCPECGAPYHRACYREAGGCVYEDQHGSYEWKPMNRQRAPQQPQMPPQPFVNDQYAEQPPHPHDAGSPPPFYGENQNPYGDEQNPYQSGMPYPPQYRPNPAFTRPGGPEAGHFDDNMRDREEMYGGMDPNAEIAGIKVGEYAAFIGKNSSYYLRKFKDLYDNLQVKSVNWAALIFGPFYFFSRKAKILGIFQALLLFGRLIPATILSSETVKSMAAQFGLTVTRTLPFDTEFAAMIQSMLTIMLLLSHVVFAFNANKAYFAHALKTIRTIRDETPEDTPYEELLQRLRREGGISYGKGILLALGYIVVTFALAMVTVLYMTS